VDKLIDSLDVNLLFAFASLGDIVRSLHPDLGSIRSKEVITELTYDVVAGGLWIENLHECGPVSCSAKERIRLFAYGTPKVIFRELL
jgi:hypothetical protein